MGLKKISMFLISVLILIAIVIYIKPSNIISSLSGANMLLLIAAFACANIALLCRVLKWKALISGISHRELAPIQFFGIAVSNLTPGKLGEPVKSLALKMLKGVPVSSSLPSIIWERIFDIFVMLIFGMAGIYLISSMQYIAILEISMAIFTVLIIILAAALLNRRIGKKIFSFARKFPVLSKMNKTFEKSFYSSSVSSRKGFVLCFFFTFLAWLFDGLTFSLVFLSLGGEFYLALPVIITSILSISILAGLLTSLPGGVGGTEAVMILMMGTIGMPAPIAASVALLGRLFTYFYSLFLGYFSFLWLGRKINTKEILKEIGF